MASNPSVFRYAQGDESPPVSGAKHTLDFLPPDRQTFPEARFPNRGGLSGQNSPRGIQPEKHPLTAHRFLEDTDISNDEFEGIIGRGASLSKVLDMVRMVAPTDSTVLIEGETGTGKELIAKAIHAHSKRKDRPFVKLNCAAIPVGLLESELFGHEKGAFTGAVARKVGRFEAADHGTLFLDEVGDIPSELQPKLLRVLQEREFERLGSTQTLQVNVRLVSATNCDLADLVSKKQFRSDLYYRLNVFPMPVPPLRDRAEDIPLLVRHFVKIYAARMDKVIEEIPDYIVEELGRYPWPGNIRELQNCIERAVILTSGKVLRVHLETRIPSVGIPPIRRATLKQAEREHIRKILEESNWVIGGPRGAAVRLGMKRSTLYSRMQRLGITCPESEI